MTGLLNQNEILVLHGPEESFKSVFVVQLGATIAAAEPFLRRFLVDQPRHVGIIQTEMHPAKLGERLAHMFPKSPPRGTLRFMSDLLLQKFRRTKKIEGKLELIRQWVALEPYDVLMIDTANDFFRGEESPSDERHVGALFDGLRNMQLLACALVRHDRKRRVDGPDIVDSNNEEIRGSAEWKEDPEVILSLHRADRRTHQVFLEVGKMRYGRKPEHMKLWFDAGSFRLVPLPPVIAALEAGPLSRGEVVRECAERFGLSERATDDMVKDLKPHLRETQRGHEKVFEIDRDRTADAPWNGLVSLP